jgi:hypothetical protein
LKSWAGKNGWMPSLVEPLGGGVIACGMLHENVRKITVEAVFTDRREASKWMLDHGYPPMGSHLTLHHPRYVRGGFKAQLSTDAFGIAETTFCGFISVGSYGLAVIGEDSTFRVGVHGVAYCPATKEIYRAGIDILPDTWYIHSPYDELKKVEWHAP